MSFFFFLINSVFAGFFFLFWHAIESVVFGILAIVSFLSFNSVFLPLKEHKDEAVTRISIIDRFSLKKGLYFLKKGSYYLAFTLFYTSLYGIVYWINALYGNFNNFTLFQVLLFGISSSISVVFFLLLDKRNEVVFLVFRSNFLIFSLFYILFLVYSVYLMHSIDLFSSVNIALSIFWLGSILFLDPFLREKKDYLYVFILTYILVIVYYYFRITYPLFQNSKLLILEGTVFSILYFEFLPDISFLKMFAHISKYIGIIIGYMSYIGLFIYLNVYPLSTLLFLVALIATIFHFLIHFRFKNYVSYSFSLCYVIFFYVKLLYPISVDFFIVYLLFIFILPSLFIGSTFVFRAKYLIDAYFLHYSALLFSFLSIWYYFLRIGEPDILKLSVVLLFESLLLFISYLKLKK